MNIEQNLITILNESIKRLYDYNCESNELMIEIPKDNRNGDYASNIAMRLCKKLAKNPRELALQICDDIRIKNDPLIAEISVAGPGFINFRINNKELSQVINIISEKKADYGRNDSGKGQRVLMEYVSANPTGILHLGHARGAVWGDCIARMYQFSGYDILREYYVNDAGNQIDMLALSLYYRYLELFNIHNEIPADGYAGRDIIDIAKRIYAKDHDKFLKMDKEKALQEFKKMGIKYELERIRSDLKLFRCEFDSWISEKWIVSEGRVDKALETMINKGLCYESEGAYWFKSSLYGDDKDRVLKKSNGYYTYLTPDIANHLYKLERNYNKLINLWGADHHGYIPRMKAALAALGYDQDVLEVDIIQMVRLVENGVEVKMSKRSGNAVTIRELIEDIGVDAARYFFLAKANDVHFDFDLAIARAKTNENPVYYAQYAYARIASIIKNYDKEVVFKESYNLLKETKEIDILKHLNEFTNTIIEASRERKPNRLANYLQKLATYFHSFYASFKVIDENNSELTNERIAMLYAIKIVLENCFNLLGISALEKM